MTKQILSTEEILAYIKNKKQQSEYNIIDSPTCDESIIYRREYNIKTLNTIDTIDTKHYKTKNYDISSAFASDQVVNDAKLLPIGTSLSLGQEEEERSSQVNPGAVIDPIDIIYLSASLKASKTIRRTLNIDFRLTTTPPGEFNKMVFSLTHSSRGREFFSNIPEEYHNEWEYQEAYAKYIMLSSKDKWIGKGRARDKFVKGNIFRGNIELGLACVLEQRQGVPVAHLWIDGKYREITLMPVDNERYPFRYDSESNLEKVKVLPRRSSWK